VLTVLSNSFLCRGGLSFLAYCCAGHGRGELVQTVGVDSTAAGELVQEALALIIETV
jgi:hypothetical protein